MSKFRRMLVNNKGFTLIELLVVIAVLGILAAIAIPRLTNVRDKAQDTNIDAAVGSLRSGLEMYYAEEGEYPDFDAETDFDSVAGYVSDYTTIPSVNDYIDGDNTDEDFSTTTDSTSGKVDEYNVEIYSANTDAMWEFDENGFISTP